MRTLRYVGLLVVFLLASAGCNFTETTTATGISEADLALPSTTFTGVPMPAPSPSASPGPSPLSCSFNGQTYANGQSFTVYSAQSAPSGSSCSSLEEIITCLNGSLPEGTYYASCTPAAPAPNAIPVVVNDCGGLGNFNQPCVTVTVCTPGTTQCQTIPNIILSTGTGYPGFRVYSSVLNVPLLQESDPSGNPIADCQNWGTGYTSWGPVEMADVVLGTEKASNIPIHVMNSGFMNGSAVCANAYAGPSASGYNGVLGIGQASGAPSGGYFTCPASGCVANAWTGVQPVQNPITALPQDNNGYILSFPSMALTGANGYTGTLVLGIGTETNNEPTGPVTVIPLDSFGSLSWQATGGGAVNGVPLVENNAIFMVPPPSIPYCASPYTAFLCPPSDTTFNITLSAEADSGSTATYSTTQAMYPVTEYDTYQASGGAVVGSSAYAALGFSFFVGRQIYVSYPNQSTPLGKGPFMGF